MKRLNDLLEQYKNELAKVLNTDEDNAEAEAEAEAKKTP